MFLDPEEVLGHLTTRPGMRVADFGAGRGTYTFPLATRVPEGAVYAFDALPQYVEALQKRGHRNLFPLVADLNIHIPLQDNLLDAATVVNVLHALSDREKFVTELSRVMAPRGRALVADWMSSFNNMGPRDEAVLPVGDATRLFASRGFTIGDMLPAGTHHYAFVATHV